MKILVAVAIWSFALSALAQGSERDDFLKALNDFRSQPQNCLGTPMPAVPPVKLNSILNQVATLHSVDMTHNLHQLQHPGSDGNKVLQRVRRSGYVDTHQAIARVRENLIVIELTQTFADTVRELSTADLGHCVNMMSADVTEVGIGDDIGLYDAYITSDGVVQQANGRYVTMVLAQPGPKN